MPILPNQRHETFAQALAKGKSATEAYAEAGYKGDRTAASRLSTNVNVRSRVEELQGRAAQRAEWSAADRLKMLADIAGKNVEDDPRVAVSAIAEANKMQGSHAAAKHHHSGNIGTYDLTKLSDDELDRLESILGPLALAGGDQSGETEAEG